MSTPKRVVSKQDFFRNQICVLRVNIHCNGCKKKVRKLLQKIDGVDSTSIDVEQGKVVVSGNVDPATLIRKLAKSGKPAELWGAQRPPNYPSVAKTVQFEDAKWGKDNKFQKASKDQQKGTHQVHQQHIKGSKDFQMSQFKDQKSIKFSFSDDDGASDFDDFDDGFDYDFDGGGFDSHRHAPSKMAPIKGSGHGPNGMPKKSGKKGWGFHGGKSKKSGTIEIPIKVTGSTGGKNGGKNGNIGATKGGGYGEKNRSGNKNQGGGLPGEVKNGKSIDENLRGFSYSGSVGGGGGVNMSNNWAKNGAVRDGKGHMIDNMQHGFHEIDASRGPGVRNVGQMGNYPMSQMGNIPVAQGLPSMTQMNGGYHQQAAMMMNHWRPNGYDAFPPMMHARPQPAMRYGLALASPRTEHYTHFFNDENTSSCSIM